MQGTVSCLLLLVVHPQFLSPARAGADENADRLFQALQVQVRKTWGRNDLSCWIGGRFLYLFPTYGTELFEHTISCVTLTVVWQGYADELKEQGMVETNLQGEDITKVRRQQFEVSIK